MTASALTSPVVLDGRVSDEKLSELLALQAEYPGLDYKRKIDLTFTADLVELAKDVGAPMTALLMRSWSGPVPARVSTATASFSRT